jgi:hypothetical protein
MNDIRMMHMVDNNIDIDLYSSIYEKKSIQEIFNEFFSLRLKVFYYEYVVLSAVLFDFQWYNVFHQLNYLVGDQSKPRIKNFYT